MESGFMDITSWRTVGQYTGQVDVNGTKIFEGDIVKMHYFFEAVNPTTLGVFEGERVVEGDVRIGKLGTYVETEEEGSYHWVKYLQEPSEELEVIGNIHEVEK